VRDDANSFVNASEAYFASVTSTYAQSPDRFGTVEGFTDDLAAYGKVSTGAH